jgi:hypothetical protein
VYSLRPGSGSGNDGMFPVLPDLGRQGREREHLHCNEPHLFDVGESHCGNNFLFLLYQPAIRLAIGLTDLPPGESRERATFEPFWRCENPGSRTVRPSLVRERELPAVLLEISYRTLNTLQAFLARRWKHLLSFV